MFDHTSETVSPPAPLACERAAEGSARGYAIPVSSRMFPGFHTPSSRWPEARRPQPPDRPSASLARRPSTVPCALGPWCSWSCVHKRGKLDVLRARCRRKGGWRNEGVVGASTREVAIKAVGKRRTTRVECDEISKKRRTRKQVPCSSRSRHIRGAMGRLRARRATRRDRTPCKHEGDRTATVQEWKGWAGRAFASARPWEGKTWTITRRFSRNRVKPLLATQKRKLRLPAFLHARPNRAKPGAQRDDRRDVLRSPGRAPHTLDPHAHGSWRWLCALATHSALRLRRLWSSPRPDATPPTQRRGPYCCPCSRGRHTLNTLGLSHAPGVAAMLHECLLHPGYTDLCAPPLSAPPHRLYL